MQTKINSSALTPHQQTITMLHQLGIPVHRNGYQQLCIAVPRYAQDFAQSLSKELYPFVAAQSGQNNWNSVERTIRDSILDAWNHRDPQVWASYFPQQQKAPSNKLFISTLAEQIKL